LLPVATIGVLSVSRLKLSIGENPKNPQDDTASGIKEEVP